MTYPKTFDGTKVHHSKKTLTLNCMTYKILNRLAIVKNKQWYGELFTLEMPVSKATFYAFQNANGRWLTFNTSCNYPALVLQNSPIFA